MERRSMRWFAAAMAVVSLTACGGGGGDAPSDAGGSGSSANQSPSPSPGPNPDPGGTPPAPPPAGTPPSPPAPPPVGTPPAAPPPGSGTAPIPDPGPGPVAPFTVTVASAPQRGLKLDWTAVAGAVGYRIERDADASDGVDNLEFVAFVPAPAISRTFTDLPLVEAMNHKYQVRAIAAAGPELAMAADSVSGDLATSITSGPTTLDDSSGNMARAMATALRDNSRHVLAVGLPGANLGMGTVKIYERPITGGAWVEAQPGLSLESLELEDHFGASVALSPNGMYLAVGIPGDDGATDGSGVNPDPLPTALDVKDSGAVQVYRYVAGAGWTPDARIKAINAGPRDSFGAAVAISNDGHLIVGAPNEDGSFPPGGYWINSFIPAGLGDDRTNAQDRGAVYGYGRSSVGYSSVLYMKPPIDGGGRSLYYGAALALDALGQRLAVGAPGASYNGSRAGGVVFYDLSWNLTTPTEVFPEAALKEHVGTGGERSVPLTDDPPLSSSAFRGLGGALAMSALGDWVAAGYAEKGGLVTGTGVSLPPNAGQVALYRHQGGAWAWHSSPTAPAPRANDRFGISVSLVNEGKGLQLLVGAREDSSGHNGLMRAADIAPESFSSTPETGAAHYFVANADPSQPMVLKARLKSPNRIHQEWLGLSIAMTKDGNELLLSGQYQDDPNEPFAKVIFFGY